MPTPEEIEQQAEERKADAERQANLEKAHQQEAEARKKLAEAQQELREAKIKQQTEGGERNFLGL